MGTTEARASWQDIAARVQQNRDDSIARVLPGNIRIAEDGEHIPLHALHVPRSVLSAEDIAITEKPILELLAALKSGDLTAVAATEAFLRRAAVAQKLTNCIFELVPERALSRARDLDKTFKESGPVGPLHGLPMSVKASCGLVNSVTAGGFVGFADNIAPFDNFLVANLEAAGAVFFARTTEPQGLMTLECASNLTGATTNPHNTKLSSGGSSGGEGALIARRGSLLGIGSDIGGSIRAPAANCGIYGLRPTAFRLPIIGTFSYLAGMETVWGTLGPMSTSLEGIELFMKTVLNSQPWLGDLSLHQMPWRDLEIPKKLTIGVIALREVVERPVQHSDFEVIDWQPYQTEEAIEILKRLCAPDGGEAFTRAVDNSGEPWNPLAKFVLTEQEGIENLPQYKVWEWVMKRELYRYMFLQKWNTKAPCMDVILCPATPHPAPAHGTSRYWGYTSVWNLLDYPGITFPVSKVDIELDKRDESYQARNEMDRWYHNHYDVKEQEGVLVGLQLVGKKLNDEKVVQALGIIKAKINLPFVDCINV